MRVRRLELLRYGRFTDRVLDLPAGEPDIHIVFGPNEAGKSTALSALEDLLFGIPRNSPLNFLHDYQSMRIGAVIEAGQKSLTFRRRKGNKDTLLTPDDAPLAGADGILAAFLGGADRDFFARMFFLDHGRLSQGGQEILAARDEVGQTLFSAGAGLEGLRENLLALDVQASALWAPKKAAHRAYYQAEERLKAAEAELRDHTVTVRDWTQRRRALDDANDRFSAIEAEVRRGEKELRKLARIRRVYRGVTQQLELEASLAALGAVTPLPQDAREILDSAERDDRDTAAGIGALTAELESVQAERETLVCDEALLLRAEDIEQLHERRIRVRAGKADLPERRSELNAGERQLLQLARELDWHDSDTETLTNRIPSRPRVSRVRSLLNRSGQLKSAVETSANALREAEERLADVEQQLQALPAAVDLTALQALIRATRDNGDIVARISAEARELRQARIAIERCLGALQPALDDPQTAILLGTPSRETVEQYRDQARSLSQRLRDCRENLRKARHERDRLQQVRERLIGEQQLVSTEELTRLRQLRQAGWSLIQRRYVENTPVTGEALRTVVGTFPDLPAAYEAAVANADNAADRRYEHAEATAELALLAGRIDDEQITLQEYQSEEQALLSESAAAQAAWEALWSAAPFEPGTPDTMLDWLARRSELIAASDQHSRSHRQLTALESEERDAVERLIAELGTLGANVESLQGQRLPVVLEAAAEVAQSHEKAAERRSEETRRQRVAQQDAQRKRQQLGEAEKNQAEWRVAWQGALSEIGLELTAEPEAIGPQIEALDEMRELVASITELREERIGKIETYIEDFRHDVAALVLVVAPDLKNTEPEDAVLTLEARLKTAERVRNAQADLDGRINKLKTDIGRLEENRRHSLDAIQNLKQLASAETVEALKSAIDQSDRYRQLKLHSARIVETLNEEGDGFDLAHLRSECRNADLDDIMTRESVLNGELDDLREQLMDARENRNGASQAFESIGGDDAAARAAADRQAALASMEQVAMQYVRLRTTFLLLQWGIERYRREQQAPLLRRAGELFAVLSGNSFTELKLAFDDQDHAHLIGVRTDGSTVGVDGMSTGTSDQLYLALRVAAIEDYVRRSGPLPFVADDLFINFDDQRAGAGFRVLGELARSCQVIFFTHHAHLLDIARSALSPGISVIRLAE